jgi:indole-3-glycerol phosphate synthase
VLEARAAGAGGVLLIVAMLSDAALAELLAAAREQACSCCSRPSMKPTSSAPRISLRAAGRAGRAGRARDAPDAPVLVGVNTRDLRTLAVDPERLARLAPRLPPGVPAVAEAACTRPSMRRRRRRSVTVSRWWAPR